MSTPLTSILIIRMAEAGYGIDDIDVKLRRDHGVLMDRMTIKLWVWLTVSRMREEQRCAIVPTAVVSCLEKPAVNPDLSTSTGVTSR